MTFKKTPPILNENLSGFYGNSITIPFKMDLITSEIDIIGFVLKIKTIQTDNVKIIKESSIECWDKEKSQITFYNLDANKLNKGTYYKIFLAYQFKNGETSPFSTPAIIKYTYEPEIIFTQIGSNKITSIYRTKDLSERLYSYLFYVYDTDDNLILKTDEKIYNFEDVIDNQYYLNNEIELEINILLQEGKKYFVQFQGITVNNIEIKSKYFSFIAPGHYPANSDLKLNAVLDYNNGIIQVDLLSKTGENNFISGNYKMARIDTKNLNNQVELFNFNFFNAKLPLTLFKDNTIEQGESYQYILYQCNDLGYSSEKIKSNLVEADFDSIFLSDKKQQLKIYFNSKVPSFKAIVQETKQHTIGSKYPFILKNGITNYKEFSISGLISYLQDENILFKSTHQFKEKIFSTELIKENFYEERKFKLDVLEWLNNGEPKIFRSPSEGNYLIQLMNTSLTPASDAINRLVHNFSSTACEIDEFSIQTLLKYNLISSDAEKYNNLIIKKISYPIEKLNDIENLIDELPKNSVLKSISFEIDNKYPGAWIIFNTQDLYVQNGFYLTGEQLFNIQSSKHLKIRVKNNNILKDSNLLYLKTSNNLTYPENIGNINIEYETSYDSNEELIKFSISQFEIPCYQQFGQGKNKNLLDNLILEQHSKLSNIFLSDIYIKKIPIYNINNQYWNEIDMINPTEIIPNVLYQVFDKQNKFISWSYWNLQEEKIPGSEDTFIDAMGIFKIGNNYWTSLDDQSKELIIILPNLIYKVFDEKNNFIYYLKWNLIEHIISTDIEIPTFKYWYKLKDTDYLIEKNIDLNQISLENNFSYISASPGVVVELGCRISKYINE